LQTTPTASPLSLIIGTVRDAGKKFESQQKMHDNLSLQMSTSSIQTTIDDVKNSQGQRIGAASANERHRRRIYWLGMACLDYQSQMIFLQDHLDIFDISDELWTRAVRGRKSE
jgi:hypothetical protein